MTSRVRPSTLLAAAAALLPAVLIASDHAHIVSDFRTATITIDGRQDDWSGALTPLGNEPFAIQVVNDADALYMRLTASDPAVRGQILRHGLIVWFDDGGGTKKKLGIHYPVVEGGSNPEGGRGYGRGNHSHSDGDAESRDGYEPPSRVDILGPGKDDARSLTVDHASGVEVALQVAEGTVVYELKVPLAKSADHPYAIATSPGSTIGLGFETPKPEHSAEGNPGGYGGGHGGGMGGGGMGGGMHGGGMHGGGGGGGRGRSGGGEQGYQPPKPIKTWATVTLSRPPAQ